jgi:hypothetical protein
MQDTHLFLEVKRMRKTQPKRIVSPARLFEPNAFYERVIDLRRTSPSAFDSLAPPTKLALGQYEAQKRERLQAIRDEPVAE